MNKNPNAEKALSEDKGEQCVYCGKDSWTCEHFEPTEFQTCEVETEAERNQ